MLQWVPEDCNLIYALCQTSSICIHDNKVDFDFDKVKNFNVTFMHKYILNLFRVLKAFFFHLWYIYLVVELLVCDSPMVNEEVTLSPVDLDVSLTTNNPWSQLV